MHIFQIFHCKLQFLSSPIKTNFLFFLINKYINVISKRVDLDLIDRNILDSKLN